MRGMVFFKSSQSEEIRPMMRYQPPANDPLFSVNVQLETRVRKDHPLRKIKELVDFDFIYKEVEKTYGKNGNLSVPPPVILKLMLLLILYNVRSERELMDTLPERLDWLWFLGLTIESPIPDHSVLSKARKRWGEEAFKHFFERIVVHCVEEGLVDGTKIFMDSSLIDADASNNSVVDTHALKRYLNERYRELEKRLEVGETGESQEADSRKTRTVVNSRYVSTTDSDASIVRHAGGRAKLRYKTHRAVDGLHEVITTVKVTPGVVDDGHEMGFLIEEHEKNTDGTVTTVVADSKYGTKENLLLCHDKGIQAHVPTIKAITSGTSSREGIFSEERFVYHKETDTHTCPAGHVLKKRSIHEDKQNIEYAASKKDCDACSLRSGCTRSKGFRTVQRHVRQEELDPMLALTKTHAAKNDLKTRQHLMERSYARSTRFGFDRARWRGLWKVGIQEYFVSAIQNIETLIRYGKKPTKGVRIAPLKTLARAVWAYTTGIFPFRGEEYEPAVLRPRVSLEW
jgi:transposase